MTSSPKTLLRVCAALALLAIVVVAVPARASTASDLESARQELADARAQLKVLTQRWQESQSDLARAQDAVYEAQANIASLKAQLVGIQRRLNERVAAMFMSGGLTLGAFLTSDSFADVADRWQFSSAVAQGDRDLSNEVAVAVELLRREEARLASAAMDAAAATQELAGERHALEQKVGENLALVARLSRQFQDEQDRLALDLPATGSVSVSGSGAIQTCPVAGENSFVDSFGWPRPGGRVHQGIDMIAAYGTPVVSVHAGTVHTAANALGGNAVVVYHDGSSDWTYYAHLSSYGASGHVSAGTVIGHVGSTGDTNVNHLHFEYHPGGGAAIDPYGILLAVC